MNTPLVSAIIPVKNGAQYLSAAIESIVQNDYAPLEIIVVYDHSVDRTVEVAQSFQNVRCIPNKGHGASCAYNTGIEAANGDLIAFNAHDDLWTPDKLRVQVAYMMAHPEVQYTITRMKLFLEPGSTPPLGFKQHLLEGDHVGKLLETLIARKPLFERIGKFNPDIEISMDADWYAMASDQNISMAIIPNVLLYRRVHNSNLSLSVTANGKRYNEEMLTILKRSVARKKQSRGSSIA